MIAFESLLLGVCGAAAVSSLVPVLASLLPIAAIRRMTVREAPGCA